jgi:hypothetical protein
MVYSLNIYTLAVYDNAELADEIKTSKSDTDELSDDRTFWTDDEREAYRKWSKEFYKLGIKILED